MVRLDMDMNEQNDMDMTIDWRYKSESQRKSGFPHAWTTLDVYKHVGINVGIPMLQYLHDLKLFTFILYIYDVL